MYLRCGIYTKICMYNVQYSSKHNNYNYKAIYSDGKNFNDVLYNHAYYYM